MWTLIPFQKTLTSFYLKLAAPLKVVNLQCDSMQLGIFCQSRPEQPRQSLEQRSMMFLATRDILHRTDLAGLLELCTLTQGLTLIGGSKIG